MTHSHVTQSQSLRKGGSRRLSDALQHTATHCNTFSEFGRIRRQPQNGNPENVVAALEKGRHSMAI